MINERDVVASVAKDDERTKIIVKTSIIGILVNVLLAVLKVIMGTISNSIAIVLDGVNNLTDALSSVITIVGTQLAGREPDKKHPYGYGRIEYMSQLIVSAIVLYAGITALVESIKKIINPTIPEYSTVTIVLIVSAVVAKLILGEYVKRKGKAVKSGALVASGTDATSDAMLSASVLLAAILYVFTKFNIEAYVGVVIALFIIKSGLELIKEALDEILGQRVEADTSSEVKEIVMGFEEVQGVYDLFLNNYGPDRFVGSLHIEIADEFSAADIDKLTRKISEKVYRDVGVLVTAIGIYAMNNSDDETSRLKTNIQKIVRRHEGVIQTHGYYFDKENNTILFDLIIDYAANNREEIFAKIKEELKNEYPQYEFFITLDLDVSD